MSIIVETRQAGRSQTEEFPLGDDEIVAALAKLDGGQTTIIEITVDRNMLFVAGGAGRYTVTSLMDDGSSQALVGNHQGIGDVIMLIGGQQTPQPCRYIVDGDRALKTAKYFLKAGSLDHGEAWEEP